MEGWRTRFKGECAIDCIEVRRLRDLLGENDVPLYLSHFSARDLEALCCLYLVITSSVPDSLSKESDVGCRTYLSILVEIAMETSEVLVTVQVIGNTYRHCGENFQ